jgi:integrase
MPKKRENESVRGAYFSWLIRRRSGVWQADGRSNSPDAGRHSLGTKDRVEALRLVHELDLKRAVELGLADRSLLKQEAAALVPLDEGRKRYLDFVSRPAVAGGATARTVRRYEAIFDKFTEFASANQIRYWQQVTRTVVHNYGRWLEERDYKPRTLYIELTTLKQAIKWMVEEGMLPATSRVTTKLKKVQGTTTYCYSPEEVRAIIAHSRGREELAWLGDVVTTLATTGLRIGELSELRWSNVDFKRNVIHLRDTSGLARKSERRDAQTTKSRRDRILDIHQKDLLPLLRRLHREQRTDQRVFHGPKGGRLKADTVRVVLQREVLAALSEQFPGADGRPGITSGRVHSFRHYFASMAANENVPEQVLMDWLGHQESRMIRHYYHLRREEAQKQMGRLPSLGTEVGPDEFGEAG